MGPAALMINKESFLLNKWEIVFSSLKLRVGVRKEEIIIYAGDKIDVIKKDKGAYDRQTNENPCFFA